MPRTVSGQPLVDLTGRNFRGYGGHASERKLLGVIRNPQKLALAFCDCPKRKDCERIAKAFLLSG